jgi:hypothetical protein
MMGHGTNHLALERETMCDISKRLVDHKNWMNITIEMQHLVKVCSNRCAFWYIARNHTRGLVIVMGLLFSGDS